MVAIMRTGGRRRVICPCDPQCPEFRTFFFELLEDPMTAAMGAPVDEILDAFEAKHMKTCERCQEYGVANIDVE